MRKLTTAIAGLLLAMMAFGQVNEEVVDGKKLNKRKNGTADYLPAHPMVLFVLSMSIRQYK